MDLQEGIDFKMVSPANRSESQDKNNAVDAGDNDAASCGAHDTHCNIFS